jgi:bifunctional DNA-binding transcriptional regulator/antitoxin component of YhaV-PrlF toxin-antitoxin module
MKTANRSRYYISRITSKGQTTIPGVVRSILGLKEGSEIAFKPAQGGFMLVRITTTIKENDPYTPAEWEKIKKLSAKRGKVFKSEKTLLKYLHKA